MAQKIVWTQEAEDTFDSIISYLEAHWTEKEMRNFVHKVFRVISQIEKNPFQFKSTDYNDIRIGYISKHTRLIYKINDGEGVVELYSFWNNRKSPTRRPY